MKLVVFLICALSVPASADWSGFRGPNGAGVAGDGNPPVEFGADKNVLWKTPVAAGHSSPIIAGNRVVVTAFESGKLWTLALDRATGKVIWKAEAPAKVVEKVHDFSSPAASTAATDGQRVYVYFGSFGLLAYDLEGKEVWRVPLPAPETDSWGSASSPIVVGDRVVQVCDSNAKDASFLLAVEGATGKTIWKKSRPGFKANWSTPMVWKHDGIDELIVAGSGRVVAYDPKTGDERWSVGGFSDYAITTPVASEGLLLVSSGGPAGGESTMDIPAFEQMLQRFDRNRDQKLGEREIPADQGIVLRKEVARDVTGNFVPFSRIFGFSDENNDKQVTQPEWQKMLQWVTNNGPLLAAIRPGAKGDGTLTHVAWKVTRGLPEMPSPILLEGRLYWVRDGGLLTCLDAASGKELYRQRLEAPGQYAASPVAAGGHLYFVSVAGVVTVVRGGETAEVVSRTELFERILATPAIVADTIYLRTDKHLYAFQRK